jgi:Domain of unknown function (DUF4872)/Butirosin biosynthesis protein H, N-terminal
MAWVGSERPAVHEGHLMTDQKHKKQRVRERMARTGETYSTAHRHIVAGRADRPVDGRHHESTLLARLLSRAGYVAPHTGQPYTEAMACGLGGGIGFMYTVFEYTGLPPIMTIVMQHHPDPWTPGALGRLGIRHTEEHGGAKPALAALHRYLDAGHPVHCSIASSFPTEPRTVLVVGRTDGTFLVDDGGPEPGPMSEADFGAAWSGYKKGRHQRIVLDPPGPAVDLDKAVRASIATTVAHLTGPVLGNSFDANFGFSGMARLAAGLRDARTKTGWPARFGAPEAFAFGIRRLRQCLDLEYTSAGGTRPLYAEFLDEAAALLGDPRLAEAAALFRESGALWSEIASRAGAAADGLGEFAELAQRRAMVRLMRGDDAELTARMAALEPVQLPEVVPLFAELADVVDLARKTEEHAVALLS